MKPMLFNTDMVKALLEYRKVVTRRLMKPQPTQDCGGMWKYKTCYFTGGGTFPQSGIDEYAPYHVGDILYVRETWAEMPYGYVYRADGETPDGWDCFDKWRPSIHMPKEAARIFLRVKEVRVERLQSITEEQAQAEGAFLALECKTPEGPVIYEDDRGYYVPGFKAIWDGTVKPADRDRYGWNANPWVWVIEFDRCKKTEGEL